MRAMPKAYARAGGRRIPPVYSDAMKPISQFARRTLRAVRIAATDRRIPRSLRWLAALGIAPVPGPFDEILLVLVAVPLFLFYRRPLAEAWRQAAPPPSA